MTNLAGSMQSSKRLWARAIAALLQFFLQAPGSGDAGARQAVEAMLKDYDAVTPKELQLATQIIALTWSSLACLGTAASVRALSAEETQDLRDSAAALNALYVKSANALTARRNERAKTPNAPAHESQQWDEGAFQLIINQAVDKYNTAMARRALAISNVKPRVSRAKFPVFCAEQMTSSVLARRSRLH